VTWGAVVLMIGLAVLAALWLRNIGTGAGSHDQAPPGPGRDHGRLVAGAVCAE
jgi:hypothetical protein